LIYIEPDSEETWIEWFCKRKGHEYLCEVDKSFIEDINLEGLKKRFINYNQIIDVILDYEREEDDKIDIDTRI
jgi:hypothetical protein